MKLVFVIGFLVLLAQSSLLPMSRLSTSKSARVFTPAEPFSGGAGFSVEIVVGDSVLQLQLDTGSSDLLVYSAACLSCTGTDFVPRLNESVDCATDLAAVTDGAQSCSLCTPPYCNCSACACPGEGNCPLGYCDAPDETCFGATCYGDGSGLIFQPVNEFISIGDLPLTPVRLGSIVDTYGQGGLGGGCGGALGGNPGFDTAVSGIWGVSFPGISVLQVMALDQLIDENSLENVISFCIDETGNAGFFSVGENYPLDKRFTFVDLASSNEYRFNVDLMAFAGAESPFAVTTDFADDCLADSGTTVYVLPSAVLQNMFTSLSGFCDSTVLVGICGQTFNTSILNGNEYNLSDEQVEAYPAWIIDLGGGIAIELDNYIVDTGSGFIGLFSDGGSECILGEFLFSEYVISMDRENGRIGFADIEACGSKARTGSSKSLAASLPLALF